MKDFSYITNAHPGYIENLYADYVKDPGSVDADMRKFFEGFDFAVSNSNGQKAATFQETTVAPMQLDKEFSVYQLIDAYRKKGHLVAKTNPIRERKDRYANLELKYFALEDADLENEFIAAKFIGLEKSTLRTILDHLKKCYTGSLGVEYSSLNDSKRIDWIRNAVEHIMLEPVPLEQKRRILQKLNEGVMFEKFLQTKYIGQKR